MGEQQINRMIKKIKKQSWSHHIHIEPTLKSALMIISEHKKNSACILNIDMQNLSPFLSFFLNISRFWFLNRNYRFHIWTKLSSF